MKLKFLSIGLMLTICAVKTQAQEAYIQNKISPAQNPGNFNIYGHGHALRLVAVDTFSNNTGGNVLYGFNKLDATWNGIRWGMGIVGNETGVNGIGSDFGIWSYNNNSTWKSTGFYINRNTGNVGIGTMAPTSKLHVQGGNLQVFNDPNQLAYVTIGTAPSVRWSLIRRASNDSVQGYGLTVFEDNTAEIPGSGGPRMHFSPGGNVGIGLTTPEARLHIAYGQQTIKLGVGTNTSGYALEIGANDNGVNLTNNSTVRGYNFTNARGRLMTIDSIGNVRIGGHGYSSHKLSVNGSAIFTKAVVKAYANWPDFVFEDDYRLQPIEEVMSFVKEHKHLPGIPSAKEVAEKGQDLGEMNAKLLQKVEELTLYIAEMKKEIDALKADRKK